MFTQPEEVFKEWLSGVNSGNLQAVLNLYSEEAVLMPTFSDIIRTDREGLEDYFNNVAQCGRVSVDLVEGSLVVQPISGEGYSLVGVYRWVLGTGQNEKRFNARFTYTVDLSRERPIIHHHSSVVPEKG